MADNINTSGFGSASFTLSVDAGSFDASLKKAGQTAKQVSDVIGKDLAQGSANAGRGLLQLGYAIDDVQYGFHAIVNNIPQIVMGLGMGAGMTGVISILAVAANQLVNHWDQLSSSWDSSAQKLPTLRTDIKGLTEDLDKLKIKIDELEKSTTEGHWFGAKFDLTEMQKLKDLKKLQAEGLQDLKDMKLIESFGPESTKGRKENARAFQQAVAQMPEGADTIIKQLTQKLSPKEAQALLAAALRGERPAMEEISKAITVGEPGFLLREALPDVREERRIKKEETKRAEEVSKEFEENSRKKAEKEAKLAQDMKIAGLEEQKHQLERQRTAIQEQAQDIKPLSVKGSLRELVTSMQTDIINQVPKQQLEQAKELNRKIDVLNEEIRKQRNVARFG